MFVCLARCPPSRSRRLWRLTASPSFPRPRSPSSLSLLLQYPFSLPRFLARLKFPRLLNCTGRWRRCNYYPNDSNHGGEYGDAFKFDFPAYSLDPGKRCVVKISGNIWPPPAAKMSFHLLKDAAHTRKLNRIKLRLRPNVI